MARIYDEPLNNRSGIGGKEEMQREHSVRTMHDQEEKHESERFEGVEEQRLEDVREADEAKRELAEEAGTDAL